MADQRSSSTPPFYKVLGDDQGSHHGGTGRWVKNRWRTVEGPVVPCSNGIHYCRRDQLVHWLGPTWHYQEREVERDAA